MKDLNNPSVYGIGYLSYGIYDVSTHKKAYVKWKSMIQRCVDKKIHKKIPSYIGCYIDKDWHNFQNFAKWYYENYIDGFELDKDILFKGNKCYSANTCCFVPKEINVLLTLRKNKRGNYPIGVSEKKGRFVSIVNISGEQIHLGMFSTIDEAFNSYKKAKEIYIKKTALKYKKVLSKECYKSLINWKIEITD